MVRRARTHEQGFVLLMAMATLASLLTLTSVMLTRSMTEQLASTHFINKQRAFQWAEARLDDVLATLAQDPSSILYVMGDPDGDGLGDPDCLPMTWGSPAQITCTITDVTPNLPAFNVMVSTRQLQITTEATINGTRQRVEAVAQVEGASIFQWAIAVTLELDFRFGGHLVDAYDSTSISYPYLGWSLMTARPIEAQVRANVDQPLQTLGS